MRLTSTRLEGAGSGKQNKSSRGKDIKYRGRRESDGGCGEEPAITSLKNT